MMCGFYPSETGLNDGVFIHNQVKALQKLKEKYADIDVDVLLIDLRSCRKKRPFGYSEYIHDGVIVKRFSCPCGPIPGVLDVLGKIATKRGMAEYIRQYGKPDIIHSHFFGTSVQGVTLKRKYGIPLVMTEHSSGVMNVEWNPFNQKKYAYVYNSADAVVSVSESLKKKISEVTKKNIYVIPNVIPGYFFEKNDGYKTESDNDCFRFISVGALINGKRFDLTIKAFKAFHEKHNNSELMIVGKGELENQIKKMIVELGISEWVKIMGQIPNRKLPELYRLSNCFVLPSDRETFGVVYAEAAAVGLPIIATKCGGPEDIVNKSNGLLVPVNDEDALCDAMCYVYDNIANYRHDVISEDIRFRFSEEAVSKQLLSLYSKVLDGDGI